MLSVAIFAFSCTNGTEKLAITYTTTDNQPLDKEFDAYAFDANITEHTYENGKGRIVFDKPITKIGEDAFSDCISLTSITIPDSVTEIGDGAFECCSSLTCVAIPDSVTSIGEDAFEDCISLTSVTIGKSVTEIREDAFCDCSSLTSVTIPDSVTKIGETAFQNCSSLTSVTIGKSVTEIGVAAFAGCSSLTSFYGKYSSDDKRCLIKGGKLLIAFAPYGLTEYTIPNGVTGIGEEAFEGCSSLTSVTIPDSVTAIGYYAFQDCSSLTSIYCKPVTPPTLGSSVFEGVSSSAKIYVPRASVDAYKSASGWSGYVSKIVGYDF